MTRHQAEWAELPPEMLWRVLGFLPPSPELCRFRAVCTAWRAAYDAHAVGLGPVTLETAATPLPGRVHAIVPSVGCAATREDEYMIRASLLGNMDTVVGFHRRAAPNERCHACRTRALTALGIGCLLRRAGRTLTELNLSGVAMDLVAASAIGANGRLLQELVLQRTNLNDSQLEAIATRCRGLQHLDVAYNSSITDAGVAAWAGKHLVRLRWLNIAFCFELTDKAVELFEKHCTMLQAILISDLGLGNPFIDADKHATVKRASMPPLPGDALQLIEAALFFVEV